jgi:RHS repeat-associated protein
MAAGLTQVLEDGTNAYLYGVERIAQEEASSKEYFLGDALGSVRQLVDDEGTVTLAKEYEPYGEVNSSAGGGVTSYGFTGEWLDEFVELLYLRSRYYSLSQGRFLTRDTWEGDYNSPISYNAWLYVNSNPINLIDPTGFQPCDEACIDTDHRNLTYWIIEAMKANAQSSDVAQLRTLNHIGNLELSKTLIEWFLSQNSGLLDPKCDFASVILNSEGYKYKTQAYSDWINLVKLGARWDFKNRISEELGLNIRLCGFDGCKWFFYDVIANIHFGYVGRAAGFSSVELHGGAGWAQGIDSPGTGSLLTLGDEPEDFWEVEMGIYLYHLARPVRLDEFSFKIALDTYKNYIKKGTHPVNPYFNNQFVIDPALGPKFPLNYFNGSGE